jgi:ATP-binding cassette ChvD family protein
MNAHQYVYQMQRLGKVFQSGRVVLKEISLSFLRGAKIGVLGLNGAGKSTLLRIMAGEDKEYVGEAWPAEGLRIGFLRQEPVLDADKTVMENVLEGVAETKALLGRFEEVNASFAEVTDDVDAMQALMDEQAALQEQIEAADAWNMEREIELAMDALRCPPGDVDVGPLSGGERRRVALCRLLLSKPDMLLLDEPTNHLDAESVTWLEHYLDEYSGTVVAVTHDRYFLDNVAGWILELDRGHGIPWKGNYSSWLEQKEKRLAQEGRENRAIQRQLRHELEWIHASPRARQAKGKARLTAYESLLAESVDRERQAPTNQITIPAGPRLGDVVVEAVHLGKGFGDRLLIEDLSFRLPPGGIVGVIGPNGAGKTTLFRMITGEETPDSGALRLGETVKLGFVDQSRDALDDKKTVWEAISDGLDVIELGKREVPSRAYVSWFNFKGSDQQKPVSVLSGGERNRVHLATMLKSGANLLLLDEPTNDLDVETLRALEEAILTFAGCVVVISHDRWFLDRIATHILAFEGDSEVVWFEGNYADYEADRKRRLGDTAEQPHRIRYKPLSR